MLLYDKLVPRLTHLCINRIPNFDRNMVQKKKKQRHEGWPDVAYPYRTDLAASTKTNQYSRVGRRVTICGFHKKLLGAAAWKSTLATVGCNQGASVQKNSLDHAAVELFGRPLVVFLHLCHHGRRRHHYGGSRCVRKVTSARTEFLPDVSCSGRLTCHFLHFLDETGATVWCAKLFPYLCDTARSSFCPEPVDY